MARVIKDTDVLLVVLCHNSSPVTRKFLDHFYKNTDVGSVFLLMIDNGSTDDTPQILSDLESKYNNVKIMTMDSNLGVIGGRNIGFDFFKQEKAQYIMHLDNDQFVQKGWLDHHLAVLNRGYDLIGIYAWQMGPTFLPVKCIASLSEWFNYVGCGGHLIRRTVVEALGGYDERFNPSYFEDPDYIFQSYDAGFKIGWNAKAKVVHVPHQTLGHIKDKKERFIRSLEHFRKKWKGRKSPVFKQTPIPELI